MTPSYSLRLRAPWADGAIYAQAMAWLKQFDKDEVEIGNGAWTNLNGTVYVSVLVFEHEEDRTAFILCFPELT